MRFWIGYALVDRLLTYPEARNLSRWPFPIQVSVSPCACSLSATTTAQHYLPDTVSPHACFLSRCRAAVNIAQKAMPAIGDPPKRMIYRWCRCLLQLVRLKLSPPLLPAKRCFRPIVGKQGRCRFREGVSVGRLGRSWFHGGTGGRDAGEVWVAWMP